MSIMIRFAAFLIFFGLSLATAPAIAKPQQPNIIFILVDDLRHDELGFMGSEVPTPAIDELAKKGVVLENAFVTTSLCSPSRASLLTGMAMRNHGVIDNNVPLSDALTIFPERLKDAGYETAFIGKWHMGVKADPRRGFDHWVSFAGQGSYNPRDLLGRPAVFNINGKSVPQNGYITDELTTYATQWLNDQRWNRPFFLYISHKGVHAPFTPAKRHKGTVEPSAVDTTKYRKGDEPGTPMWVTNQRNSWHGVEFAYHDNLGLAEFRRDYRETLRAVDDSVALLRAHLEQIGASKNTIIILSSDNGFLLGEHGLTDKRNAYEASMRVPMIAWGPSYLRAGIRESGLVANIDVAPTIIDLAGAVPLEQIDGISFAHLLTGKNAKGSKRSELVYEYYWEFNYPHTPTTFALRDDRYKYIQYHGIWDTEELFDLVNDPAETRNLVDNPEYLNRLVEMRLKLFTGLASRGGTHDISFSRKFNQGAVFRRQDGSVAAEFPERWLRDPGAFDRLEHIIPDSPNKTRMIESLNKAIAADE